MRTWIQCDRPGLPAGRAPRDLAELGARIREAATLAVALHLGVTAEQMSNAEMNDPERAASREACR